MADSTPNVLQQLSTLNNSLVMRQLGMLVGLAALVAVGVGIFVWAQNPNYGLLFSGLAEKDASLIIDALNKSAVPYKLSGMGSILVPSNRLHEVRLKLAAEGLPKGGGVGFESLQEPQGFGVSQFRERASFNRSLEVELSRSIATLNNVNSVRVHLALPKRSTFLRNKQQASASVVLKLYSGRELEDGQVAAITHLVASSIPNLKVEQVTVIDQRGKLLTSKNGSQDIILTSSQFDYRRKLEKSYIESIEDIITPIVGSGNIKAKVTAELDFTVNEQTQESFNPDAPALRSTQSTEENSSGAYRGGIPGALTNQPPGDASLAQSTSDSGDGKTAIPSNTRKNSIRNYELDRTISHTRTSVGRLQRLSIAVVINDRASVNEQGETTRRSYTPEEMDRITGIIKETVGYSPQRGDTVSVINELFSIPPVPEALPELPMWEQPWFYDVVKQVLGVGVALILGFGVLRVVTQQAKEIKGTIKQISLANQQARENQGSGDDGSLAGQNQPKLAAPSSVSANLEVAKSVVESDPKVAAQVVKSWVAVDG